jgi:hypothetical protein
MLQIQRGSSKNKIYLNIILYLEMKVTSLDHDFFWYMIVLLILVF